MQKIVLSIIAILLIGFAPDATAKGDKDGYRIKLKFTDVTDSMVYIVHYFGKPLPTIYKTDSARLDKKGEAVFESNEKVLGGIYMILLSDKKTYFEFLMHNGTNMSITASAKQAPDGATFKNSPENERFVTYVKYLKSYGEKQLALKKQLETATTAKDTATLNDEFKELGQELVVYRNNYIAKYPNTLLTNIFKALTVPVVPEGPHKLPDGTNDSTFGYRYYKEHYWDDFVFSDDRLINTPIYDGRLNQYMNDLVLQIEDSVVKESDMLLAKARGSEELFKYTLYWLTKNAEQSKVMGMDAVFVYLVENYYMKGDATWLSPEDLAKYIDRAHKIAPNVIGNIAPELKMPDINGKEQSLHAINASYTLLVFWSPECGHCLEEIPKLDSVYKAELKDKGVKIYGVRTDSDMDTWKKVIKEKGLEDWIHVHDPERKTRFRSDYDIYSTPVLYLLDEKKIIRGKRIDHTNILDVIKMVERQKKDNKS